ncbi:TRM11 family SAM-dependent methyltransferase [Virgisporangium aurantiacum]|uniref:TRM11 family SAM-dependent methyltransferase n=1 Tax=Virgisporangium aurantiacum TaxID=175570 RepID=UPI0019513816|nr:DNA methyltransferase [Virgisporangium aurantiacum]
MHTSAAPLQAAISGIGQDHIGPVATLWPTGQDSDAAQRTGRYVPQTQCHPQRTRPALAAQAIERYSRPGQTVFDPFVGSGTTVVEAVHAGRRAIGVDIDPRWVELTERNLDHARRHGATGTAMIVRGDARHLQPVPRRLRGAVDLVLATPPIRLHPPPGYPARRWSNADLVGQLETDLKLSFASWIPLLHPGTTIVLTSRLLHRAHQMLDLTVPIAYAAEWAGLDLVERVAALNVPIRDTSRLRPITRSRRRASRPRVIHDNVLVYRVPDVPPTWWRGRR